MKNSKFIIYNETKLFKDFEIFAHITNLLSKGLISNNETEYCYASTWNYEKNILCIETQKQKYGYKIIVYEKEKINNGIMDKNTK